MGLALIEHQDSIYSWASKIVQPNIPTTNLPNTFSITQPTSLTLDDDMIEYSDVTVITRLLITVGASPDRFVEGYEVQIKQTLDKDGNAVTQDYKLVGEGKTLDYQVLNVIDGATYQVRVRAKNALNVRSTFISSTRLVIGFAISCTKAANRISIFSVSFAALSTTCIVWKKISL